MRRDRHPCTNDSASGSRHMREQAASTATPNTPPSSRIALFAPRPCPGQAHGAQHDVRHRREEERHADAEIMNGGTKSTYGVVGVLTEAIQSRRRPGGRAPRPSVAARRCDRRGARDRRDQHRHRRPRQDPQARLQRRVALHGLEVRARKKIEPNIPKNMKSDATFVSVNVRLRKNSIGSIGDGARSSQAANAATSSTRGRSARRCRRSSSRASSRARGPRRCRTCPYSRREAQEVEATLAAFVSSSRAYASGASTIPIGTLSQKIQCHEMPLTTAPPTSGPIAIARPPIPPQMPSASPRRSAGTAAERIVSVSGVTIAAPTP